MYSPLYAEEKLILFDLMTPCDTRRSVKNIQIYIIWVDKLLLLASRQPSAGMCGVL